jgi:hypothetical protein
MHCSSAPAVKLLSATRSPHWQMLWVLVVGGEIQEREIVQKSQHILLDIVRLSPNFFPRPRWSVCFLLPYSRPRRRCIYILLVNFSPLYVVNHYHPGSFWIMRMSIPTYTKPYLLSPAPTLPSAVLCTPLPNHTSDTSASQGPGIQMFRAIQLATDASLHEQARSRPILCRFPFAGVGKRPPCAGVLLERYRPAGYSLEEKGERGWRSL